MIVKIHYVPNENGAARRKSEIIKNVDDCYFTKNHFVLDLRNGKQMAIDKNKVWQFRIYDINNKF